VADALLRGDPSGGIVGSRFVEVAHAVRDALSTPQLRIYDTRDITGVELASAMVGLLSLAIGFARGFEVGPGTLGVFATRGMAEAVRLSRFRGAQAETFAGLAGAGDLLAAVADDGRPELRLGYALATDPEFQSDGKHIGAHIEGIDVAHRVTQYGQRVGITTPITDTISAVLRQELKPEEAMALLMARRVGTE
jgi:glycerol-3-phosphate dehydrogenase (NAD(P)+)